jgi:hypothetical protein
MADTTDSGQSTPATTTKTTTGKPTRATQGTTQARTATTRRSTTRRTTSGRATTTSTQPKTRVEAAQVLAERAVLVPVGAGLLARDNLVSTVKGLATKYRTRAGVERELKRYERRGASARNRFERQVRRTRTKFERELRQRRTSVERSVKQNRRRVEREVRSVRRDLERQGGTIGARAQKLVSDAQERLTAPRS